MTRTVRFFFAALAFTLSGHAGPPQSVPSTPVGITRITISQRQIGFDGQSFGSAGQYELLDGTAYGELDPHAPANSGIVNLNNASVGANGHVSYSSNVTILKPVDIAKGNGTLLYIVANRGVKRGLVEQNNEIGLQFLLRHGYTVVWSGWQGDLPDNPEFVRGHFPIALHDGKPLVGKSREEFTDVPAESPFTERLTYPAATLDSAAATLTVREHEGDPRTSLSSKAWSYMDADHVRITQASGFDRGAIYEFIYPATNAVVMGIGFAETRDLISFLRYADQDSTGAPNPVRQPNTVFKATLGLGASLSGRFMKDFVYQGFNADVSGRMVFDGVVSSTSGGRRTYTNYQFAQPGRFSRQHEDHLYSGDQFPFTYATTTDPISGKTDGLLLKCGKSHTCPRIMHLDTDTEFWQARSSLVVTDTSGRRPLAIPSNVRIYMFSGFPHVTGKPPLSRGKCEQYLNEVSFSPYERALLVALGRWVTDGVEPPRSRYPNLNDHTLVTLAKARSIYPTIPGAPFSDVINQLQVVDPDSMPPVPTGSYYPLLVALTNSDGNPIGGVESPEITVPVATYAGRNIRAEGSSEGDLCELYGEYIPFAATRKERMASGDSRLSLEERYSSQQDFANKRKHAVDTLVQERLVLPEDAAALAAASLPTASPDKP